MRRGPARRAFALNDSAWYIAAILETEEPALLAEALDQAREACRLTGRESWQYLDTLAEVHYRMGDRERALQVIEEALAIDPSDLDYLEKQRARFGM